MKIFKNRKIITPILILIGLFLFVTLGFNTQKAGPSYAQNCTDVADDYEPCQLHNVHYGSPFTYAEGRPLIPGMGYTREKVKPMPVVANAAIWIIPLPLLYLLLTRHKK